jgi:hypothetical protein
MTTAFELFGKSINNLRTAIEAMIHKDLESHRAYQIAKALKTCTDPVRMRILQQEYRCELEKINNPS